MQQQENKISNGRQSCAMSHTDHKYEDNSKKEDNPQKEDDPKMKMTP